MSTERILIGIAGRKGHGKDTAARGLDGLGFENVKFAGPLKDMTRAYLRSVGVDASTIERMVEGDLKETPSEFLAGKTPRFFMQKLGTEFGRDIMGTNFWTDAFRHAIRGKARVVCTDMRFPNEVHTVLSEGGQTIRVVRPYAQATEGSDHPSETQIDTLLVQREWVNDGTAETLGELMRNFAMPLVEAQEDAAAERKRRLLAEIDAGLHDEIIELARTRDDRHSVRLRFDARHGELHHAPVPPLDAVARRFIPRHIVGSKEVVLGEGRA